MRILAGLKALAHHPPILRASGSLVGTMLITGGLGFLFWLAAARSFGTEDVGFAAAAVSAMMVLAIIGMFGLGTLFIREAPQHPHRELQLIATGVLATGLLGFGLGLIFAYTAPLVASTFRHLDVNPQNALAFAFGTGLTTSVLVLDQCLVGLQRGEIQLVRNTIFSTVKLAAVVTAGLFLASRSGMLIFATWVIGDIVSVLVLALVLWRRGGLHLAAPREWELLRSLLPRAFGHHLLNVGLLVPSWALPVMVAAILSAELTAPYFVAQLIAGPGLFVPGALAFSLFAVAARAPEELHRKVRATLGLSFLSATVAGLAVLVLGRPLLGLFGPTYVEQATLPLLLLTLTMFPLTIKLHFINLRRIQGRTAEGAAFAVGGAIFELSAAAVGAVVAGVAGVAAGVLISMSMQALVMAPVVWAAALHHAPAADSGSPRIRLETSPAVGPEVE